MATKSNMPAVPFVGLAFRPYQTDATGIVTNVESTTKGKGKRRTTTYVVTYRFEHDGPPAEAPRYSRPYSELRGMAFER